MRHPPGKASSDCWSIASCPFNVNCNVQAAAPHYALESQESIMICSYPAAHPARKSAEVEADMEYVSTIVAKARSIRTGEDLKHFAI